MGTVDTSHKLGTGPCSKKHFFTYEKCFGHRVFIGCRIFRSNFRFRTKIRQIVTTILKLQSFTEINFKTFDLLVLIIFEYLVFAFYNHQTG